VTDRPHIETPEDVAILQALRTFDSADAGDLATRLRESDEADDALLRQYTEILGILAYAVEPQAPAPHLRDRIRLALAGDETQRIDPGVVPAGAADAGRPARERHSAPPSPRPARAPYWLAAVFALLAVGLAAGLFWLSRELETHRGRLAAQENLLQELNTRLEAARSEHEAAARDQRTERLEIEDRLGLVTAARTEICPLRPPARSPQPEAVGVLYVAADHQHWYLRVEGLRPPEDERVFQLWFVAGEDRRPVSGGIFRVTKDEAVHLGSPTMPEGTTAALVTVEPPDGRDQPTGPVVLYGDQLMRIL
jgi:hypothetical protein